MKYLGRKMPSEIKGRKSDSGMTPEVYKNLLHLWQDRKWFPVLLQVAKRTNDESWYYLSNPTKGTLYHFTFVLL